MMEASSASKAEEFSESGTHSISGVINVPEELELEDVWSDLHALRKLYGLLHGNNGNILHRVNKETLDDKSRILLKKLLDGATQQALQCQSKIISCAREPPPSPKPPEDYRSSEALVQKEEQRPEEVPAIHRESPPAVVPYQATTQEISQWVKPENEHQPGRGRVCDKKRHLERHKPDESSTTRVSDQKRLSAGKHGGRDPVRRIQPAGDQAHRGRSLADRSSASRGVKPRRSPSLVGTNQKRSRVEPAEALGPSPTRSRTRVEAPVQRESTQPKDSLRPKTGGVLIVGPETIKPVVVEKAALPRRMGSRKQNRTDEVAQVRDTREATEPMAGPKELDRGGQRSAGRHLRTQKPPSPPRSPSREVSRAERRIPGPPRLTTNVARTRGGPHRCTSRVRSRSIYSSGYSARSKTSSLAHESSSSARSECEPSDHGSYKRIPRLEDQRALTRPPLGPTRPSTNQIVARRIPSIAASPRRTRNTASIRVARRELAERKHLQYLTVGGHSTRPLGTNKKADRQKKTENREGRLRRFKNKLAIIFHHHHHHHHVDGHDDGHRGSPWSYLRRILHHERKADEGKLVAEVRAERAAGRRHSQGYLHSLLDALLRHVWGTRQRRAAKAQRRRLGRAAGRLGVKKLQWWQRFRRRGGVKLTNLKKPRLKLGFGRNYSRGTKN